VAQLAESNKPPRWCTLSTVKCFQWPLNVRNGVARFQ
jgi:hypothetical protein